MRAGSPQASFWKATSLASGRWHGSFPSVREAFPVGEGHAPKAWSVACVNDFASLSAVHGGRIHPVSDVSGQLICGSCQSDGFTRSVHAEDASCG